MEDIASYKIKINQEVGLLIESQKPLSSAQIQPILDTSLLHQKAQHQHEKEIDKQHQIYTLMMVALFSLGLFSVSFTTIRTLSKYFKISEAISYVG